MSEHDHLSTAQVRALIEQRIKKAKPVGRLIHTLRTRGERTTEYQAQRTTSDIAAHIRWYSYQGQAAPEETSELERRNKRKRQS
jgi:ribosomal protein S6